MEVLHRKQNYTDVQIYAGLTLSLPINFQKHNKNKKEVFSIDWKEN